MIEFVFELFLSICGAVVALFYPARSAAVRRLQWLVAGCLLGGMTGLILGTFGFVLRSSLLLSIPAICGGLLLIIAAGWLGWLVERTHLDRD